MTPTGFCADAALAMSRGEGGTGLDEGLETLRQLMAELFAARVAINRFGANVNQAVAALHATGQALPWLRAAVERCARAVQRLDAVAEEIHRALP